MTFNKLIYKSYKIYKFLGLNKCLRRNFNIEKVYSLILRELSFLVFLSCFAIGFSSWISNTLNKDDANINALIGNIEDYNIFTQLELYICLLLVQID